MKYFFTFAFMIVLSSFLASSCAAQHESGSYSQSNPGIKSASEVIATGFPNVTSGWVEQTLGSMTLEEKAAQLMSPRVNSYYLSADSERYQQMVHYVEDLKVGGLTFFQGKIFELASYTNDMQRRSNVPLLISADFERGVSMRISRATSFPVNMALGATRDTTIAYRIGKAIAREGRALGVHQNFAPVLDVNNNAGNPVINVRSFGENPGLVADMGNAYMRGLHDGGMISTGKHFPGHGDTDADSHIGLPVIPYAMDRLNEIELVPFRQTIDNGLMSVMTAHIALPLLTEETVLPATLSTRLMTDLLRDELNFKGIIVTDAMDMYGISNRYSSGESAVKAIKAGVDMVLLPPDPEDAIRSVVDAVNSGEITEDRIDESVRRILSAKEWSGLNENRFIDLQSVRSVIAGREHRELALEAARRSMTLVRNDDEVLPLRLRQNNKVLIVSITDRENQMLLTSRETFGQPFQPAGDYFANLFRSRYRPVEVIRLDPGSNRQDIDTLLEKAQEADIIIGASYIVSRSGSGEIGIPENNLKVLRTIAEMDKPFILTSFGDPYFIRDLPGVRAYLSAWSGSEAAIEAAVETLFGDNNPQGLLPISIPGYGEYGEGLHYSAE